MGSKLIPTRFQKSDIAKVQDFDCGTEDHQWPLADWIKNHSLTALEHKTKIWLYWTEGGGLAGYGSLGKNKIHLPDGTEVRLLSIPCLALQKPYWHKPDGVGREGRFSYQLVRHLQAEAYDWHCSSPVLEPRTMLYVHPKNKPGIKLYRNTGFADYPPPPDAPYTYPDPVTGAACTLMLCQLPAAPAA